MKFKILFPVLIAVLAYTGYRAYKTFSVKGPSAMEIQTERMARSEALLLAWSKTHYLNGLGNALEGKIFPDEGCRKYFADQFRFKGVVEEFPEYYEVMNAGTAGKRTWEISDNFVTYHNSDSPKPNELQDFSALSLYGSLFENVDYFEFAKLKIHLPVPEWIDPETMTQWKVSLKFSAKAKMKNGRLAEIKGWQDVVWEHDVSTRLDPVPDNQIWKIISWEVKELSCIETDGWLFEEVLDDVIPDKEDLELARQSIHEGQVADFLKSVNEGTEFKKPYPRWRVFTDERHPTVSVVDLNEDGFDDFYVQERHGKNLFFQNNGDGTFREIAGELGLDIEGNTATSMFSDFDNDGDLDVFIGGTLRRSLIFENVNGRFIDRSGEWVPAESLPYHTSSVSVVDINNDGLNDIYISTYAAFYVRRAIKSLLGNRAVQSVDESNNQADGEDDRLVQLKPFLREKDWDTLLPMYYHAAEKSLLHRDRPGPPNVMLVNVGGGKFKEQSMPEEVNVFKNTFQATFADIDNDGDKDFYLANDFAPNFLFKNDGKGNFSDVTNDANVADVGFGMGVTWGDYDNDGLQDLYVTNMFSKAARRVTSFFTPGRVNYDEELLQGQGIDPLFEQLGRGNSMYRNVANGEWEKVSEVGMPLHEVEFGGWGWGAQFADFNNDGFLDLYGPAGYYTAPKEQSRDVDL